MNRKIKSSIDAALESGEHIVFGGGRGYQKKMIQDYIFAKQFPKGKVAIISPNGIRESDLADYEEIETKLKQAIKDEQGRRKITEQIPHIGREICLYRWV